MLNISNFRAVSKGGVIVCDAMVTKNGKFESFISRFSTDDYVEYSASSVPTYNHYFTNESYEADSTERFIKCSNPDENELDGFMDSGYIVGYKLLDQVELKYKFSQAVNQPDYEIDEYEIAAMKVNGIIKGLEFYETPGGVACGPICGDTYAELLIEDKRDGKEYYVNVSEHLDYVSAFINDYSGMDNVKSDPEHEKYDFFEDMFEGYIETIDSTNTEIFDNPDVLKLRFGKAILLCVKLIYKDFDSDKDKDLVECAKAAIKPYIGKSLGEIDVPISWEEFKTV